MGIGYVKAVREVGSPRIEGGGIMRGLFIVTVVGGECLSGDDVLDLDAGTGAGMRLPPNLWFRACRRTLLCISTSRV